MPHVDRLIYGTQVWPELTHAAGRRKRWRCAAAGLGRHAAELMPLDDGDVAVVDASTNALKAGQSSPDAIASWLQAGAYVYSYEGLHAKAYLLGSCAFVGSANASRHSQEQLLEAVLHTDRREIRDQVRAMVLDLANLAVEPLDADWVAHAKGLYRPPRRPAGRSRPGREQVLPIGPYRLRYSTWTTETFPETDPQAATTMAELSGPGVEIYRWVLEARHGIRTGDVVVLMEYGPAGDAVSLWPPMRVLRLSPVHRGQQVLYLRHSRKLQPLPAGEANVRVALRGLAEDRWVDGERRKRLLSLWGLDQS
jgi:hypothetical protein